MVNEELKQAVQAATARQQQDRSPRKTEEDEWVNRLFELFGRIAAQYDGSQVPPGRIRGLLYSKGFLKYWLDEKEAWDTEKNLAYTLLVGGLKSRQVWTVLIAWKLEHGRWVGQKQLDDLSRILEQAEREAQPAIEQNRVKTNRSQRIRRARKKNMPEVVFEIDANEPKPEAKKRGRPKDTSSDALGNRILEELKKGPATPRMLAETLGATLTAVQSQLLYRKTEGKIRKLARGLYELVPGQE